MTQSIGRIFNIQRFSVHDGPGIRTTVFMKGCNLRCAWCHNPESYQAECQIRYQPERCVECQMCADVCVQGVYIRDKERINRQLCTACGRCTEECLYGALEMWGEDKTVSEVAEIVKRDAAYYKNSNGGLTVSGGEPLLQPEFVRELFRRMQEEGIHTALDTAGNVPYKEFEKVLPYTDLILLDLKIMNDDIHRQYTGCSNRLILENAERLFETGKRIQIRVPLVKGINDGLENAFLLRDFIKGRSNVEEIKLLPYHSMGIAKAGNLGEVMKCFEPPDISTLEEIKKVVNESVR